MSSAVVSVQDSLSSEHLNRSLKLTFIKPRLPKNQTLSVLLVFDGQDFPAIRAEQALAQFLTNQPDRPVLLVGIHANEDRIEEYGTASQPDYAHRGSKASHTTAFVVYELIPYIKKHYVVSLDTRQWAVAGFSLGGLMALDLGWHHPEFFAKVGVFSGSFWWRKRALDDGYHTSDRIAHQIVRETEEKPDLSFWFQTGTRDETDDRDGDGVIDSIADTLDLIAELERKGYGWGKDITYLEVTEGEHNPQTWSKTFPVFLLWCFSHGSPAN
jgi:enterochelin esterase-like enzyme